MTFRWLPKFCVRKCSKGARVDASECWNCRDRGGFLGPTLRRCIRGNIIYRGFFKTVSWRLDLSALIGVMVFATAAICRSPSLPASRRPMPGGAAVVVALGHAHAAPSHRYVPASDRYVPTPVGQAEARRREAAKEENARQSKLAKLLLSYDTNKSGKLDRKEVIKLLTDMDSSTPPGTKPTKAQVSFMLSAYDKGGDGVIQLDELQELLSGWETYTENKELFEERLKKYDVDQTGRISWDELKAYLTDLNGGIAVKDSEVDWVMKESDLNGNMQLGKMELWRATAMWYSYVESNKKSKSCSILWRSGETTSVTSVSASHHQIRVSGRAHLRRAPKVLVLSFFYKATKRVGSGRFSRMWMGKGTMQFRCNQRCLLWFLYKQVGNLDGSEAFQKTPPIPLFGFWQFGFSSQL